MNVSNENAKAAADGCYFAAAMYAGYVLLCGYRVYKLAKKKPDREALDRYD